MDGWVIEREVKTESIGSQIDRLWRTREAKRALENQMRDIEATISALEMEVMALLQAQGIDKAAGKNATASIQQSVVPQVEDWDAFYAFIRRHNYFHLLERRPAVAGCRELFESRKRPVPGVVPFVKRKLSLRTH